MAEERERGGERWLRRGHRACQEVLCMLGSHTQHPKVGGVFGSCVLALHPGPGLRSFPQLQPPPQLGPVGLCRPAKPAPAWF